MPEFKIKQYRRKKMYNILVLGISGNVSLGILKVLRHEKTDCKIIGGCVKINTASDLWCDETLETPYANDPVFIQWLIDICNQKNIHLFLTGVEEILYTVAENIDLLKKNTNTIFIVSDFQMLKIGQNKLFTCKWLKDNDFNYPKYALSQNRQEVEALCKEVGFPLIAKPVNGKGSHGLRIIKDSDDLENLYSVKDLIIQQFIGDENSEYTVGCYMCRNGKAVEPIIMQRWLNNGATWRVRVVKNEKIQRQAINICKVFKPMGPMNIQLRLDKNGIPIPFELNVRFSGSTPMRTYFGFHDIKATVSEYLENKSVDDLFEIKTGEAFRYVNEIYNFTDSDNLIIDKTPEN